ncbi:MAG: protein kinase [Anaerolineales bacterium]|nr:protein kinase [Anaerolineales bacterium]
MPESTLFAGRYRLQRKLGKGGMGAVYECEDTRLSGHLVALKENTNVGEDAQEQFKREALILSRLSHPNLPKVTDYFLEPSGQQYLVMDYVPGEDMDHIIRREGALSEPEARRCLEQVLEAVHYLHTWHDPHTGRLQPVIHRDIKPSNIKRTQDGRYVLVDFGISKFTATTATIPSMRALTPGFAPIEQYDGGTDERTDIYALGATFYTLLTGHIPPTATERARKKAPLTSPRKYSQGISTRSEQVIARALMVDPVDRYQTAADMFQALFGYPLSTQPSRPQHSRRLRPVPLLLAVVGLLLVAIAWIVFASQSATPPFATTDTPSIVANGSGAGSPTPTPTLRAADANLPEPTLDQPVGDATDGVALPVRSTAATTTLMPVTTLDQVGAITASGAGSPVAQALVTPAPTATPLGSQSETDANELASASPVAAKLAVPPTPLPTPIATVVTAPTPLPTLPPNANASPSPQPTSTALPSPAASIASTSLPRVMPTASATPPPPPTSTTLPSPTAPPTSTPLPRLTPTASATPSPEPTSTAPPAPTATPTSTPLPKPTATSTTKPFPTSTAPHHRQLLRLRDHLRRQHLPCAPHRHRLASQRAATSTHWPSLPRFQP